MTGPLVIDCNLLVSALIARNALSPPAQLIQAARRGEVEYLLSRDLLEEYRDVLNRERIQSLHRRTERETAAILAELIAAGTMVVPPLTPDEGPDPNDAHLWRLLRTHGDAVLVTGDKRLIAAAPAWAHVIDARTWLQQR